jgi:hypothetical protein
MAEAKKTKTDGAAQAGAAAPTATKTPEQIKQEKEAAQAKDRFVRVFTTKDGKQVAADSNSKKLPPQAQTICNILEAAGEKGLTRAELIEKMKGVVQTRQPEGRILSYYQKLIQDRGMVTMAASK